MADEIRADYNELTQVSSRFANQSQAIGELLQKVQSSLDPLEDGGWIGRGADSFFAEMRGVVLPAIQRLQQALDDAGQTTNEIAQTMKNAEDEASAVFRNF